MNFKKSFYEAWVNKSEVDLINLYNNDSSAFMSLKVSNHLSLLQAVVTYNFNDLLKKLIPHLDSAQINELLIYSLDNTLVGSFHILLKHTPALVIIDSRDLLNELLEQVYRVDPEIFKELEKIEISYEILEKAEKKLKTVSKDTGTMKNYENLFKLKHAQILNNMLPSSLQKTKFNKI